MGIPLALWRIFEQFRRAKASEDGPAKRAREKFRGCRSFFGLSRKRFPSAITQKFQIQRGN